MKKYYFLIIVALILGLTLTGCLLSNVGQVPANEQSGITYLTKATEGDPLVTTLFAGQDIDVGTVSVWNDCSNLYVKYETIDGWVMTETHLAVVADSDDFPMTEKGNPIPGQFPYQCCYDEDAVQWEFQIKEGNEFAVCDADDLPETCLTVITYTIPLDWELDIELFIAAHAVVERTETGTFTPELAWQRSSEPTTFFFSGWGAAWTPAVVFTIPLNPSQTVWDNGGYYNNSVPAGREWASWLHVNTGYSDLRRFQATFTIPAGYTVTGGSLYAPHFTLGIPINDNVYIFVNQNLLFWGGTRVNQISDGTFLGMAGIQTLRGSAEPKETDRWYIPGTIPEVTGFIPDENVIDIFTEENARWGGMGKLVFEFSYEKTYSESAWGAGTRFVDKGNWATYFTYNIITELTISSEDLAGPFTVDVLEYFDVTTVNPECGSEYSAVLFNYTIFGINPTDILVFDYYYYDGTDWVWGNMPKSSDGSGNVIGYFGDPTTGFPMSAPYSETTTFRIKITNSGTYTVEMTLDNFNAPHEELASFTQDVVVN